MKTYKDHRFSEIFPLGATDGPEWEEFKTSIKNRQREPILLFEGKILDGRRRYRACREVGTEPMVVLFRGGHRDALELSFEKNIHRRNLKAGQRAGAWKAYRIELENLAAYIIEQSAKEGGRGNKKNPALNSGQGLGRKGRTSHQVAEKAGVGHSTVDCEKRVSEKGIDELQALVKEGKVAVSAAAEVAKLPPAEQQKVVTRGPAAVKEHASNVRKGKKSPLKWLNYWWDRATEEERDSFRDRIG